MSSLLADPGASVLDRVGVVLTAASDERLWAASDDDVVGRVEAALRVRAQADAVLLAAVGEVDARGLARARGAPSTRAWLTGAHRVDPGEAGVLVRTGRSLRAGCAATGVAMASGEVSLAQARVIIRSVEDLPVDLGPGLIATGEATMIGHAAVFEPSTLAVIGRRLAECIDPDGTQARDEQKLLDKEKTAHGKRFLTLIADKAGAGRFVRGYADTEGAAIIAAALDALSAPIAATGAGQPDPRSPAQRRHDALVELCRRQIAGGGLPSSGGVKPRIVITIPTHSLTERTGAGRVQDGSQLSPTLTRYLCCDAEIIGCRTDRHGTVLDLGRTQRLFTGPARLAMELRDRGCAWPGCDRPLSWTQAHHIISWLDGGRTDQNNGVLLCGYHHREIETGQWAVFIQNGRAWFRPPAWIDPRRTPILNPTHHPPPT